LYFVARATTVTKKLSVSLRFSCAACISTGLYTLPERHAAKLVNEHEVGGLFRVIAFAAKGMDVSVVCARFCDWRPHTCEMQSSLDDRDFDCAELVPLPFFTSWGWNWQAARPALQAFLGATGTSATTVLLSLSPRWWPIRRFIGKRPHESL
jgi:hypothetical protein